MAPENSNNAAVNKENNSSNRHFVLTRDGSSQAGRLRPSLDPSYVAVDERTVKDLLTFARAYAQELAYFDVINEQVTAVGDWRDFFRFEGSELDLDELVAFLQNPSSLSEEQKRPFTRPHFTLFLTFLHLLTHAQKQLNTFTERHLDFYYQQVLKMNKRASTPDKVNVLVDIAANTEQFLLAAGTLLDAGSDSQGQDLIYRTDQEMVVSHAQVAKLSSIFVAKENGEDPDELYAAADATAVNTTLNIKADKNNPRWRTFGQEIPSAANNPPPPDIGWAFCSPLLALSAGDRTITVSLGFDPLQFDTQKIRDLLTSGANNPFCIEVTTAKGWIEAEQLEISILQMPQNEEETPLSTIQIKLNFASNIDPIAPLATTETQFNTELPQLRIMLRQIWQPTQDEAAAGKYIIHYKPFQNLILRQVAVEVAVAGLVPTHMQNDEATLDPNKPFEPFGQQAQAGSRLLFGHPELINKPISSLEFQMEWMEGPGNLVEHYKNYPARTDIENNSFKFHFTFVDERAKIDLGNHQLFDTTITQTTTNDVSTTNYAPSTNGAHTISIPQTPEAISNGRSANQVYNEAEVELDNDLFAWNRYIQWELNEPGFQHDTYPIAAMQKSMELAAAISKGPPGPTDLSKFQVNPPYTPKIKSFSFDYTASVEIKMDSYAPGSQIDKLLYIQPFGYSEIQTSAVEQDEAQEEKCEYFFLPPLEFEGQLFIGLSNTQLPQNVSLLFQMAEGSAEPIPATDQKPIQWSFLSNNQWISLEADGNLLQDTTRGLKNSGIIIFALAAVRPSTLLPPDYYWIRAAIEENSRAVCDTVGIHTQAISATFIDQNNAPGHLQQPLAAQSISDLVDPLPTVVGIRQPYSSYGGKMAEKTALFYTRVSERLRHKQRALTIWDYEHLILDHFPQIYKVKCLPANANKLGHIEIIVIPDIKNKFPFNPFEPKAPSDLIADIEMFLADKIPPFTTVTVKNATFVPIRARFSVRFLPGYNEGFYKQQLNEDLNRFLSPWAYAEGADIVIGGRIYANVLVNFIDERPYVDFVGELKLYKDGYRVPESKTDGLYVDTKDANGKLLPDGVLVSARQHDIGIESKDSDADNIFAGINFMRIWDGARQPDVDDFKVK